MALPFEIKASEDDKKLILESAYGGSHIVWGTFKDTFLHISTIYSSFCLNFQLVFNPFPDKPLFLLVCSTSLLKTL